MYEEAGTGQHQQDGGVVFGVAVTVLFRPCSPW
jgi:hypothetical protein